ncbi:MAG: hypothetical protein KJ066_16280 [Acidobacteria bacterium]|nr:hypothetical protein [Acidobacteriota bacterium]
MAVTFAEAAWRGDLGCFAARLTYDFGTKTGTLALAPDACTDMDGAIALFTAIDPAVQRIETFTSGIRDTTYARRGNEWRAFSPARRGPDQPAGGAPRPPQSADPAELGGRGGHTGCLIQCAAITI